AFERQRPAGVGLTRLHGHAHRQVDESLTVEPGRERVAHAPDRVLELAALALDLLDLALELARHLVELAAELRELVVAVDRHGLAEVAPSEAPGRLQELIDLTLKRADDEHGQDERDAEEAEQDDPDQHAT